MGLHPPSTLPAANLSLPNSLRHNTCLNRKIAVDAEGNIRNCPSMKERYGNIRDTTLAQALMKPGFKKYWSITKDRVTKCRGLRVPACLHRLQGPTLMIRRISMQHRLNVVMILIPANGRNGA
ncbi:MAG: hypothetical protein KL787_01185 [Taibaiella sp.]|nr:hypothetical protein [Taibaiella sp.]